MLDDLFAQLDSDDKTVQGVSAEVINDVQLSQRQEKERPRKLKKDSKTRFLERQVRISFEFLQHNLQHPFPGTESCRDRSTVHPWKPSGGCPDRKGDKGRESKH